MAEPSGALTLYGTEDERSQITDPVKPNMGLSFKGSRVRKADVTVAKSYLSSDEVAMLNSLTTQFLHFAERRARRRQQITIIERARTTFQFIRVNDMQRLPGAGRGSHSEAEATYHARYEDVDTQHQAMEAVRADDAAAREIPNYSLLKASPTLRKSSSSRLKRRS
ncbi:RhuM family protein [Nonomuraea sp. NPDC049607]|uniref:RhuM family protein n=1 Tax=Nonomuraea sp. NPDC049607 TaxID=3154732 RepID=UPI0034260636